MAATKRTSSGTKAKPKAAAASTASHNSYQDMIKAAILSLKDRKGSSRQAIKKYIQSNNKLGNVTDAQFNSHLNRAFTSGETSGLFERPKGPSGPVKLKKPAPAATKQATAKPAAEKKPTTTTKKPAGRSKKATTTVAKPKATTTKKAGLPKANTSAARTKKTTTAAPAVEAKPAVVLGKTKSGRVTKSTAPQAKPTKKAAPKKAAPKKKSVAKSTPKKEA